MFYQNKALEQRKQIKKLGNIVGILITVFLLCQLFLVSAVMGLGLYDLYNSSLLFQNTFNTLAIEVAALIIPFGIMAYANRKKYESDLIPSERLPFVRLCAWVGFGMICCLGADYAVSFLMTVLSIFGYQLVQVDMAEPESLFACIESIVSTALIPAICEEFAMRCCTLGLLKKYGKAFGVVAVSIVFGLLHGNVLQFVFATLVGLILGYITIKTNSIVPAVFVHAFNNGISVFADLFGYLFGDKAQEVSTYVLFVLWFAVGIISIIYLLLKGQFKRPMKKPPEPYANSTWKKICSFFFVPGMIIPFIFLISFTFTTIEKI